MIRLIESSNVECFNLKSTGMSYYDDLIDDSKLNGTGNVSTSEYFKFEKGIQGDIVWMTANEYMTRCSNNIFNGIDSYNGLIQSNIDKYSDVMSNGTKFKLPMLNYANPGQEGRHRMLAASEAFGDESKFPVLIVTKSNPTDDEIRDYASRRWGKADADWGFNYVKSKFK